MALTETDIKIIIAAELKKQGFDKAKKATDGLDKTFKKLAATIGVTFSASAIIAFGKASAKAFIDDEKAAKRLTQTLANMGLAFEDPRVKDFISKMEATSGVLDDKLRPAMQGLLTTTGSVAKSQELLALAIDMSAQSGYDLETVANDLSKAYVGNTKGLSKYNLGLSKAELSAKSFSEIQSVLNKQFAGSNAAFLDTYAGKIAQLNVAYANMQETIGKSLVEAFALLSGDMGIAGATKAMADFATQVGDTITGVALLIDRINSIPGVSTFLQGLNMSNFGILGVLQALGEQNRVAPKPFQTGMSVSGASDLYTKQERDRKKAEEAAKKRAKELAALQKKAELERLKREKEAQQLKKAGTIFDMENIQIVAALQGKIDGEQRIRLVAMLALNNGIADAAEKAATAVMMLNAPALANLGIMIKSGDTITDVINKIIIAQAKVALIDLGITNLPKAKNPFELWDQILSNIITNLDTIAAKIKNMPTITSNGTVIGGAGGTTGGATGGGSTGGATGGGVGGGGGSIIVGGTLGAGTGSTQVPNGVIIPGPSGSSIFIPTSMDNPNLYGPGKIPYAALAGSSIAGPNPAISNLAKRTGDYTVDNPPTVVVNVAGSVISEEDLSAAILDNFYKYQRSGLDINVSSVSI